MNLILVGVRGSGKSAIGRALALRLGALFVDLDRRVEKRAEKSIREIFEEQGEGEFRKLEEAVLRELEGVLNTVIATGGGVVLLEQNRNLLGRLGKTIWLQVSPETAVKRMAFDKTRPSLTGLSPLEEASKIFLERSCLYEEVADVVISTESRSIKEICDELEQYWNPL